MFWNPNMECGIGIVDRQHRELFRQVELLLHTDNPERVLETIRFLENYVVSHFGTEEDMHAKSGYPKAAEHRKLHRDFVQAFLAMKQEYDRSGYTLVTLLKLNRMAVAWLQEHVLGADLDFATYRKHRSPVLC